MTRLAVFDCDGTLVDSQAHICLCMEETFAAAGLPAPSRDAIRRLVGLSLVEFVAILLPEGDAGQRAALVASYKTAFADLRASGRLEAEPLFDGIAELIADLAADGWLLGVATGKSDRGLAHVLSHHEIADHFVTLQTADRHPSKPHPAMLNAALAEAGVAPHMAAMIGDTSYDMAMARVAGVRALGVGWGYHPPEELTAAGANAVAMTVADLRRELSA